ncbi:MAG: glycosyltransferase 87 family protein, partial [Bacteroidota bacterium]
MKQRWLILICLSALLAMGMPAAAQSANLLKNSGFESMESLTQPKYWQMDYWIPGASASLTQSKVYDGKYALVLQSEIENDFRMIQTVKVKGNKVYRFSGWVATEGVPEGQYGANLCVMGGFVRSEGVNATTDWRPLELVFRTYPGQKEVTLGVRLGFYGSTNTGKVYFDGLKFEQVDNWGLAYQQIDPPQPQPRQQPDTGKADSAKTSLVDSWFYPALIILLYLLLLSGLWLKPKELNGLLYQPKLFQRLPELFFAAVALSFIIRFPLYGEVPFTTDMGNFKAWALRIAETGPLHFYAPDYYCDYPPFSLYIYWIIGGLIKVFRWGGNEWMINFLLKLPSFICDAATAWLIYVLLKKKNPALGWVLSVIYLFLPSIIYNSSYWGQVDTFYLFLILLIFYLLTKRQPEWAAVCLAASFLTKAQTLAFIPLLLFYLVVNYDWKRWLSTIFAGLVAFIMIILPFNINQPLTWIYDLYFKQAELYPYASMNAGNFIALLNGNYANDGQRIFLGITYRSLGLLLFGLSVVWSCWYYWKKRTLAALTVAFTLTSFAFFMFFPRMHERYLFPVLAFLLLLVGYTKNKILFFITLLLNLSYLLNMHTVILKFKNLLDNNVFERSIYVLGLIHTVLFIVIWLIFQIQSGKGRTLKQFLIGCGKKYRDNLSDKLAKKPFKIQKRDYLIMAALVLGYGILVLIRLGSWSTPQKGLEMLSPEQGVEVVFDKPSDIDSIAIYDAEGDGELVFEYYAGSYWNRQTYNAKEYYVLNRFSLNAANVERIRISPNPTAGKINEIAFFNTEKNVVPVKLVKPFNSSIAVIPLEHPLFDEPERMLVKSSYLNSTYFDEIYHGRTAYEFVSGSRVYETTHPQFGKDLLSLGILIFGMNPFGMRFVHAIAGIL